MYNMYWIINKKFLFFKNQIKTKACKNKKQNNKQIRSLIRRIRKKKFEP